MFFGALVMLCSALPHRRLLAVAVPGSVLAGTYFVDTLGGLVEELEGVQPFSPFYQYGSAIEHGIDWMSFGGVTLYALVLLAALAFGRRDIYT